MRSVTLVGCTDEMGVTGLRIAGMMMDDNISAANSGDLLAHDLIEHVNGIDRIGMIDDEMEALGALWVTRGQWGMIRRNDHGMYSCKENIALDFSCMAVDIAYGHGFYARTYNTKAHDHDEDFESIKAIARQQFAAEVRHLDRELLIGNRETLKAYWDSVIPALRTGARKLKRRWGEYIVANRVFWNIADAVENYCRFAEDGFRYKLSFDRNRAICRGDYDDEIY